MAGRDRRIGGSHRTCTAGRRPAAAPRRPRPRRHSRDVAARRAAGGLPLLLPALAALPGAAGDLRPDTVWVEPDRDGYPPAEAVQARRAGVNIRLATPILESSAVVGDVVWSAGGSLLGPNPGVVLRTENRAFADLVRRTQRRKRSEAKPGTGQLGEDCGRCQRMLVRYELPSRGAPDVRHECPACDRSSAGVRTRRR